MAMLSVVLLLTVTCGLAYSDNYIGIPPGMIPRCPGSTKNVTFTQKSLQKLGIVTHRVENNGRISRRFTPISQAPKTISNDKNIDLRNKKTVVYCVGYLDSSIFPHSQAIGTAYSKRGYNVFISETVAILTYFYPISVRITIGLGKKIGEFLVKLYEQGLSPDNLELVGLSMGAHIAGIAAKHFYSVTGKKPSRITGLDPAGPCFRTFSSDFRLSKDDGDKVDVLHTNIYGIGMAEPLGHIDYYANGGEFQPGDIPVIPCLVLCSHYKSALYHWQAIEHPKKFIGLKCDSLEQARSADCYNTTVTNIFGKDTDFTKPGIYYLPTNNVFPYYSGEEGLKQENEIFSSYIRNSNRDDNFVV